jgi:uncharacterized integral membrane protein (TIGR00697 family)
MNESIFLLHLVTAAALLLAAGRLGRTGITVLIVLCAILMNIVVAKQMTLFGLAVTGGNVEFATVFLANDILNEHYGPRAARRAIWISFLSGFAVIILMQFVLAYRPNREDAAHPHLHFLFNVTAYPRIVAASMVSYLLSQMLDTYLYQAIRHRTGSDKLLWWRSNASAWVSQAFDTLFFTTAGLTGPAAWGSVISTPHEWLGAVAFAYIIKILVAALDTPFLYLSTWKPFIPAGSTRASRQP